MLLLGDLGEQSSRPKPGCARVLKWRGGSVEVIERAPPVQSVSPAVRRSCNRMSRFPRTSLGLP